MTLELKICDCDELCDTVDIFLSKHYNQNEIINTNYNDKTINSWLINMKNDRALQELKNRQNMPACTCIDICCNPEQYIHTHLPFITRNCGDDNGVRAIADYLNNNHDKIRKDLNSEGFARFNRMAKHTKRIANIASGRPPVQPVPSYNPNMEKEICWKDIECKFPNCRRIHPNGRQFVYHKRYKRQACFKASLCPDIGKGCPFYHNLNVQYYDENVVKRKN